MTSIITELVYIFVNGQGYGSFSLHCKPIVVLWLLSVLWLRFCLFDTFPISILNFLFNGYKFSYLELFIIFLSMKSLQWFCYKDILYCLEVIIC